MQIKDFLNKINIHSKAIYQNEINQVYENGKIINWLLGLAGGALLFSFNRYENIEKDDIPIVIVQSLVFITIISVGFTHRIKTKSFKDNTVKMIRMLDFLKIEFEIIPDEIENDLEADGIYPVFDKYLNGKYFEEEDRIIFDKISAKQIRGYKTTRVLTILAILLMILQFGFFFYSLLNIY